MTALFDRYGRKRAEEERAELLVREQAALADAEAAIRMHDQLVASVSHDLKNPLTAISGQVQALQLLATRGRDELPPERLLSSLNPTSGTAKRMATSGSQTRQLGVAVVKS